MNTKKGVKTAYINKYIILIYKANILFSEIAKSQLYRRPNTTAYVENVKRCTDPPSLSQNLDFTGRGRRGLYTG